MDQEQQEDFHEFSPRKFIELLIKASDLDKRIVPVITYLDDVVNGTSPFKDMLEASDNTKALIDDTKHLANASRLEYISALQDMIGYLMLSQHVLYVGCKNVGPVGTGNSKEYTYTIDIKTPNFQKGDAVRDPALAIIEVLKWIEHLKQPIGNGSDVRDFMGSLNNIDLPEKIIYHSFWLAEHNGFYRVKIPSEDKPLNPMSYCTALQNLVKLAKATGVRFQFPYEPHEIIHS